jgi:hypothetical protein
MNMQQMREQRSGLVTFAGVLAMLVGIYNLVSGIAAITEDELTKAANQVLFDIDLTTWGWVWAVLGAVQILTGVLIIRRNVSGLLIGLIWAFFAAGLSVVAIFSYPTWGLVTLGLEVLVIYGLTKHMAEFGSDNV